MRPPPQVARALGARVTEVCSAANVPLVTRLGAAAIVDYTAGEAAIALGLADAVQVAPRPAPLRHCSFYP